MTKYYYIGTYLPQLSFDARPEITFSQLNQLLRDMLNESDYEKVRILRTFYDILNLRSLWLNHPLDVFGELSSLELEESLINQIGLPSYVYDYLETYHTKEDKLAHFPQLLAQFFQSAKKIKDPFLHEYLELERNLRLVLAAFRAKKLNRDLKDELQYEDPEEELVAQLLAFKDSKTFELPEQFLTIKNLFETYEDDPLALQKALDEYRFVEIDRLVDLSDTFSIDRILSYLAQFMIVDQWNHQDQVKGQQIVETLVKEIS